MAILYSAKRYTGIEDSGSITGSGGGGGASVTVSDTAPSSPSSGDLWFNSTSLKTFVYYSDGSSSQWLPSNPVGLRGPAGLTVAASDTAPSSPTAGDVWFDSSVGKTFIYYSDADSSQWIQMNPATSESSGGGSVTSYANKTAIDAVSSPSEGDLAFDEDKNVLYIRAGSTWERIQHGGNVGPRITTAPPATHSLSAAGSTSTIAIVATDESGFPVTYDWDGISGTTLYNSSSYPNQITNVSENNGVFTLTPSSNTSHSGSFIFRAKASDGAQVSTATTTVSLAFAGHLLGFANNISGVTYSSRTSIQGSPAAAFDNSTDQGHNCWHGAAFNSSLKDWLMVDFGSGNAKVVTKYGIAERYSGNDRVASWKLQGSNDGSTFTDLQSLIVEGVDVSRKVMGYNGHSLNTQSNYLSYFHSFNLSSTTAYRYIRLWVEDVGGTYPVIGEMYIEGY